MKNKFFTIVSMMSGTSADGVDGCLLKMNKDYEFQVLNSYSLEYPDELRDKLLNISVGKGTTPDICFMNFVVGEHFARCANELIRKSGINNNDVDFISTHGQTIYHIPRAVEICGYRTASTLQIGDISVISERTGIMTIGDFRTKDIAAGGQGAPLVPFADEKLFGKNKNIAIQNIGGISNVTVLSKDCKTFAFDTGLGNMLSDYYTKKFFNKNYDVDGKIASRGTVNEKWLFELLKDDYYSLIPPKSTGREYFNYEYAEKILKTAPENKYDVIRTIVELTARTIYDAYVNFVFPKTTINEIIIGGGGAYNPVLMQSLKTVFKDIPVKTHEDYGINSKLKECIAFAVLGMNTILKRPNNIPECTGASHPVIMGKISYPF